GYAAAALAFTVLAVLLGVRHRASPVGTLLLVAVTGQAIWAAVMGAALYAVPLALILAPLAEAVRILLWVLFIIRLAVVRPVTPVVLEPSPAGSAARAAPLPSVDDEPIGRASRRALVIAVALATASAGTEFIFADPSAV